MFFVLQTLVKVRETTEGCLTKLERHSRKPSIAKCSCGYRSVSWNISIETPQVEVIDDPGLPGPDLQIRTHVMDATTQIQTERSQLLDTEYRNKILDDLHEVLLNFLPCSCFCYGWLDPGDNSFCRVSDQSIFEPATGRTEQ
ncbi:PREDICTED: uncharacterized protein LOC104799305 [Tarenaya hassleriana]|uniref:uncharacterized protein LOC104799305 n=1 Tax=Tarenaya hassleriana TaxID=28532 RepID=UPI00053C1213|nr:PREDICTED: uncharacterized protein LOC104799305 [Tarenaya hassleriana]